VSRYDAELLFRTLEIDEERWNSLSFEMKKGV